MHVSFVLPTPARKRIGDDDIRHPLRGQGKHHRSALMWRLDRQVVALPLLGRRGIVARAIPRLEQMREAAP
jgi:hypothetical protein